MEWVEVTGRTVEEAKETALDQLGVDEADAEFEVVEEPRAGLFGRLRSEARVRARVRPSVPRPKVDRRDRRRSGGGSRRPQRGGGSGGSGGEGGGRAASSGDQEGDAVADREDDRDDDLPGDGEDGDEVEVAEEFLIGLLDRFEASYQVDRRDLDDDLVELSVQGDDLGLLIGPRGQTLAAVQELTRTVVQRRSRGRASRIVLDVAGYRQARRAALDRFAREVADQVLSSGRARVLEPMTPADRKVVHDAINTVAGVTTTSEGEEPRRRVVILPEKAEA